MMYMHAFKYHVTRTTNTGVEDTYTYIAQLNRAEVVIMLTTQFIMDIRTYVPIAVVGCEDLFLNFLQIRLHKVLYGPVSW